MKKFIHTILYAFSIVLLVIGCTIDDLKDENNLSLELLLTDADNVEDLLVGSYVFAGSGGSYGGQTYIASELIGSSGELIWNGTFNDGQQYIDKSMLSSNGMVSTLMADNYDVINQVNTVLFGLDLFEDQDRRKRVEGEAKFLRGLEHFDLVRFFGKQYQSGGGNSQLGVSILLTTTLNEIVENPRSSVEEVYNQVINDLNDAVSLLPNSNGVFADKYAAKALLARVYLQQQKYSSARDAANEVIQNSGHSLTADFDAAFNNDTDSSEDIFAIQVTLQAGSNTMNTFWATQANGGRPGNPDIAISDDFISSYDANDDRGNYFYTGNGGNATTKWINRNANVPLLRLAEMYLIRAECNQRLNTSIGDSPLNDVNRLRNRANAPELNSVSLDDILIERRFELAFEGHLLHDVKRLGLTAGGLPSDSNKLVLPIPEDELNTNANSSQNPGY
ncbi:MAG: RagB/SusD family nutrient uptake outer membrane protein [Flavobacterium sp.]|nr:MAG: RagB/SusD family nutrient uptake outer membrane protein [Flavobacterium sp.]